MAMAPIDLAMINYKILTTKEKNYLFDYHLEVYSKISEFLSKPEKKWLLSFIK